MKLAPALFLSAIALAVASSAGTSPANACAARADLEYRPKALHWRSHCDVPAYMIEAVKKRIEAMRKNRWDL